ncbi:MAG: hypothetical protein KKA16_11315 [Alphaproteobacteria bacterium]|nr:hypothetical protein [Alphaproteobacteria bacterium]MBU2380808.1 hypothetical protein [Alphaproteobacteria bacterium]
MTSQTINFRAIRPHGADQRIGFEELVRQLLIANPPQSCVHLEHKGPGADGGVEVLMHRSNGRVWGYQTKFFVDGFAASQISQLWDSFRSALASHPTLDRYIVVLPINLAGGVRVGRVSQRQKWENFVAEAEAEAEAVKAGRQVKIDLWDEKDSRLDRPINSDELGEKGEKRFAELCADARLIANASTRDRAGWDYIVDFKVEGATGRLDARPAPASARVQVKTQWADNSIIKLRLRTLPGRLEYRIVTGVYSEQSATITRRTTP